MDNQEATGSQETGTVDATENAGEQKGSLDNSGPMSAAEATELLARMEGEAQAEAKPEADGTEHGEGGEAEIPEEEQAASDKKSGKVVFSPEQQKLLDERIGKEVAKRKGLEDRLATIQQELDRQRRARDTASGKQPPVYDMTDAELDATEQKVQNMLAFLERNWDGTVDPDHPEKGGYTKDQIRQAYKTYSDMRVEIPNARRVQAERAAVDAVVTERYPDLAPGGERDADYQKFRSIMGPAFGKLPNGRLLFAHMLLGEQIERLRDTKQQVGQQQRVAQEPPPRLPIGSRSVRKSGAAVDGPAAHGKKALNLQRLVESGGDMNTAVELLAEAGF